MVSQGVRRESLIDEAFGRGLNKDQGGYNDRVYQKAYGHMYR